MRMIDADTLIKECEEICQRLEKHDEGIFDPTHYTLIAVRMIIDRIERQPTRRADGTVDDGYWTKGFREWRGGKREVIYFCSQCKRTSAINSTKCPHCGAAMRMKTEAD